MTLRLRLLLGYGYLVFLLLVTAFSAVLGFLELSEGIERVLAENVRSMRAITDMIEALERQDSATLTALLDPDTGEADLSQHETDFLRALERAEQNITEEEEALVLGRLREDFSAYREARDALMGERPQRPLRAYNERVFPAFTRVKRDVLRLLDINHEAMIGADRRARQTALRSGAWLGFLVMVALLSLVVLSRVLQERILGRLLDLRRITGAIAAGDTKRRLPEGGGDELATVARYFNETLDRQAAISAQMRGLLGLERQLSLALVHHLGPEHLVLALDGQTLVESLAPGHGACRKEVAQWVAEEGQRRLRESPPDEQPVRTEIRTAQGLVELELLRVAGRRPVAWIGRLIPEA
jgi:HAMP domain-containing protein